MQKWTLLYIALLSGTAYVVFGDLSSHPFSYEDRDYIANAAQAQNDWLFIFAPDKPWGGRPTVGFALYLTYKKYGVAPGGYHSLSALVHLLNSGLLAYLVLQLSRSPGTAALSGFLFLLSCSHFSAIY